MDANQFGRKPDANGDVRKRYYFDGLNVIISPKLKLGFVTCPMEQLDQQLKDVRSLFPFSFVQFQNAPIRIDAYRRSHMFETAEFLSGDFKKVC